MQTQLPEPANPRNENAIRRVYSKCHRKRVISSAFKSLAVLLLAVQIALPYSVLTHEAIIDANWQRQLVPLIEKRFQRLTREQLRSAQAYAYGGCIIQDMGYYPLSSKFFSDLVH